MFRVRNIHTNMQRGDKSLTAGPSRFRSRLTLRESYLLKKQKRERKRKAAEESLCEPERHRGRWEEEI